MICKSVRFFFFSFFSREIVKKSLKKLRNVLATTKGVEQLIIDFFKHFRAPRAREPLRNPEGGVAFNVSFSIFSLRFSIFYFTFSTFPHRLPPLYTFPLQNIFPHLFPLKLHFQVLSSINLCFCMRNHWI